MDQDDIEIEEVLYRYFRKELSASEMADVEAWRAEGQQNERMFQELRLLFLDMKGLSFYQQTGNLHLDKSWRSLREDHQIKARKSFNYIPYAASIALVLSTVLGLYLYQSRSVEPQVAIANQVLALSLSDGSIVTLNEGSQLNYLETFEENERRVQLEGEGYFDIAANPDAPFVVEVEDVEVRVLGTQFFINQVDDNLLIDVEEGKVLVSYQDQHEIVSARQSLTIDRTSMKLTNTIEDATGLTTFWKTRRLVFDQTAVEEVAKVINQAYRTSIAVKGASENCLLTVTFENESLDNVLEVVSSTLNFTVSKDHNQIVLEGDGCE